LPDCKPGPLPIPPDCRHGFVFWDGTERLLHPFGWAGEARGLNDVGSIIAGRFHPSNAYASGGGFTTYLYTAWDGRFQDLGAVWQGQPGANLSEYTSNPQGVNDDGSVVVGDTGATQKIAAFWTSETGMVNVYDFLTSKAITNHVGWILTVTTYVSPDGRIIAGAGFNRPYPATPRVPHSCRWRARYTMTSGRARGARVVWPLSSRVPGETSASLKYAIG
jgi:hypothetical protein